MIKESRVPARLSGKTRRLSCGRLKLPVTGGRDVMATRVCLNWTDRPASLASTDGPRWRSGLFAPVAVLSLVALLQMHLTRTLH